MTQEATSNEAAAFVISAKMAKALADTWRSRILMELSIRPLSPSQFVEEVGGDLNHIARCFRQLAGWDYVEIIEERSGGRRRGAVEHVYRSTQRAHFDTGTWEGLPRFLRNDFSGSILKSYIARITEAVEAGTFDAEIDRHLSWDGIALDRIAWTQIVARLDEILDCLPGLEAEANRRMTETGEEPIPTTIGLACFRSPRLSDVTSKAPWRNTNSPGPLESSPFLISAKMSKALANTWRSRIMMELSVRPLSPSKFVEETGGELTHISRCFRQLAEWRYIEVIEERPGRRGRGVERVYRSIQRAHFDTAAWEGLPRFLRDEFSGSILGSYIARLPKRLRLERSMPRPLGTSLGMELRSTERPGPISSCGLTKPLTGSRIFKLRRISE